MILLDFPLYKLIIVLITILFAGLVDSISGGGGLLSIPAYLFLGIPGHFLLGTNKFSSSIGTFFATIRFAKSNKINWTIAIISVIFALIGSTIGSRLVLLIPVNFIKILLIILIPVITVFTLLPKKGENNKFNLPQKQFESSDTKITNLINSEINTTETDYLYKKVNTEKLKDNKNQLQKLSFEFQLSKLLSNKIIYFIIAGISSLIIGMYDGFFGPGTGTFFILVYTVILKIDITTASGNAKVVNLSSNIAALVTFLIYKKVFLALGIICAFFSIIGNLIGSTLAIKKGSKVVKPFFVLALLLLLSKVIYDLIIG